MGIIKVLDSLTANKIAAGEIVEGPLSVVKELLENSLDAKADFIEIELKDGGLGLIRITDNGVGMDKEDALLAFERHATSKIKDTKDLFNISTFGFRGEALPSIASVSTVLISTKDQSSKAGVRIKIIGGQVENIENIALSTGTTIEVRNLFYNTPARRKFLKGISYETGQITELVTKYSLGHPEVRFKLISNSKVIYDTAGLHTVVYRINNIYEELKNKFIHIPYRTYNQFSVEGWLAPSIYHRNTRSQQTFFINGRLVKSSALSKSLDDVYHTLLPKGRFPIGIIQLHIDNTNLDVNIHPAKLEVKIHNIEDVREKITSYFKNELWNSNIINNSRMAIKVDYPRAPIPAQITEEIKFIKDKNHDFKQDELIITPQKIEISLPAKEVIKENNVVYGEDKKSVTIKNIANLTPIGQFNNSFILAQTDNSLYIIDQHTCHERILYEKFIQEEREKKIISENLLIPITLNLTGKQEGVLLKNILIFNELGFLVESFGTRTYLLRGLPVGLKSDNIQEVFIDLLEELDGSSSLNIVNIKEKVLIMAACKGAVKAKQKLTNAEVLYLLQELAKVNNAHSCPHGRPIFHKISIEELYKIFQRGEFRGVASC